MDRDLSLKPHQVKGNEEAWWYEILKGIEVYTSVYADNNHFQHCVLIPWRQIRSALKRKDKSTP